MHLRITEQVPACRLFFIGSYRESSLPPSSKGVDKLLFIRMRILINTGNIKFHCDKSKLQ